MPAPEEEQPRAPDDGERVAMPMRPWRRLMQLAPVARGALVIALAALIAGALTFRDPIAEWLWPDTRIQQLRDAGALALAQGRLTAADGRGAREFYEAALALDPDRVEVRQDLVRVGDAALAQAKRAVDAHRFAEAHRKLALARELAMPRARVQAVADELRVREAAVAGIDELLREAAKARAEGRLDGGDGSALELYRRVLGLEPSNTVALEGREDTLADLVQQARTALEEKRLGDAAQLIDRVRSVDDGHADLPAVIARLESRLDEHRTRATAALRRNRLERALREYEAVLAVRPDDAAARAGRNDVAAAYARRSGRLAADFQFKPAEAALRRARAIAPEVQAIAAAEARLQRARESRGRLRDRAPGVAERERVAALLRAAAQAEAAGDFISPPGESAYDRLRAAREIAPTDPRVHDATARLVPAVRACFEDELRENRLARARQCLDAWRALEASDGNVDVAQRRLAARWVAYGHERLGAGEPRRAERALHAARELDPQPEGAQELEARLGALGATR
jgi:tetratricopeptide (TPR) repeat protein